VAFHPDGSITLVPGTADPAALHAALRAFLPMLLEEPELLEASCGPTIGMDVTRFGALYGP
jgi:hypothetical protein